MSSSLKFYRFIDPAAEPYWKQLEDWLALLNNKRDNGECSYGPRSSRAWFYRNNFDIDPSDPDCILGTYFGVDPSIDLVVVTGTFVVDDRGIRAKYKVAGNKMWGLVLTHHDSRQKGHGTAMCSHMDGITQALADRKGEQVDALFTAYEPAVKIYTRLGFVHVGQVVIDDPGVTGGGEPIVEQLYSKIYAPQV